MGGFGSPGHRKRHVVNSTKDHLPIPGDHDENSIVVYDSNGLPVKDSGVQLASIMGGLIPQGGWDADTNTPEIVSGVGVAGHFWYVTVPGDTIIDGYTDWELGDIIFYDGTSSTYKKIDNTDRVWEVDGRSGAVELSQGYITKAQSIGNTPPVGSEGMKCLTSQGSGGLWAGYDWRVASFNKGLWSFRTPAVGEVFLVLTCPPDNSPVLDYQVPSLFTFKNGRWEEFVPQSIREAPYVSTTIPGIGIKNFSGQAISLFVSDVRGNDTTGDGSLFNPFKTIQEAVDYADLNYSGIPFSIVINEDLSLVAVQTVEIPAGMSVTLKCRSNYLVSIKLTVNQFCYVTTDGILVSELIENDSGDTKTITMVNGALSLVTPALVPSIYLEMNGTYCVIPYATLVGQVLAVLGSYHSEGIGGGSVVAQPGTPTEDQHLVNKGYLDGYMNGFKSPQMFYVSEDEGSDVLGDGWFYPFATVQKAVDEAVVRMWTSCDVYIDTTVDDQTVIVPDTMRLSIIGVNDFRHSENMQFTSITLGNSCVLSLDNTSTEIITSAIDGTAATIYFEESRVANVTNYSSFYFIMANAYLSAIGMPEDSVARWKAILAASAGWDGSWCAARVSGAVKTIVSNSLDVSGGDITDVQRINGIQTIKYTPVTLAGVSPVDADIVAWAPGDTGLGRGTTNRIFLMYNVSVDPNPAVVKYVELS